MKSFRYLSLLLLSLSLTSLGALAQNPSQTGEKPPSPPPDPDTVAIVNGQKITKQELIQALIRTYGRQMLDRLVDQAIIEQAAKKQGIEITPKDLEEEYEAYKRSAPSPEFFADYEKQVGKETILQNLRVRIIYRKIGEKLVSITDADLEEVKASHILIRINNNNEAEARAKAEQILKEAKAPGTNFADLAKKYSDDPGTAQNGGDLGFFGKGQMVKEFEEAAFNAKVGDIVGPVKTSFGFHIIKVEDRRSADKLDPITKLQRRERIIFNRAMDPIRQWIENQRKEAKVEKFQLLP